MHEHPNRIVRSANRCHCTTPPPRLDPAQEVDTARAALTAAVEAPTGDGSTARIDAATRRYIAASAAWREAQRAEAERRGQAAGVTPTYTVTPVSTVTPASADCRWPSITCLRCGKESYNGEDIARLYCAFCDAFHGFNLVVDSPPTSASEMTSMDRNSTDRSRD